MKAYDLDTILSYSKERNSIFPTRSLRLLTKQLIPYLGEHFVFFEMKAELAACPESSLMNIGICPVSGAEGVVINS